MQHNEELGGGFPPLVVCKKVKIEQKGLKPLYFSPVHRKSLSVRQILNPSKVKPFLDNPEDENLLIVQDL